MLNCVSCGGELDAEKGYIKITGSKNGKEDFTAYVGSVECLLSLAMEHIMEREIQTLKRRRNASAN